VLFCYGNGYCFIVLCFMWFDLGWHVECFCWGRCDWLNVDAIVCSL